MEPNGEEILTASVRLPSLLDVFFGPSREDIHCQIEIQQANFQQDVDGSWNWERVLFPDADSLQRRRSELADLGRERGWHFELSNSGQVNLSMPANDLELEHVDGSLWVRPHSVGGNLELRGQEPEGQDPHFNAEWRASRGEGEQLSDWSFELEGKSLYRDWLQAWLPEQLARVDWFGEDLGLRLRGVPQAGQLGVAGSIQGSHGQLDLAAVWSEGELRFEQAEALSYRGRPTHEDARWPLVRDLGTQLNLFHSTGQELSFSVSSARLVPGADRAEWSGSLQVEGLGMCGRAGEVLVAPSLWTAEFDSEESDRGSLLVLRQRPNDGRAGLHFQMHSGRPGEWSDLLLQAPDVPVALVESFSADDWPSRWLGKRVQLTLRAVREGQEIDLGLDMRGNEGGMQLEGRVGGERFSSGDEGQVVLTGKPERLRRAALQLLPIYQSLVPVRMEDARIRLSQFELPPSWLTQPPSSWNWGAARAQVELDFGQVQVEQKATLAGKLDAEAFETELTSTLVVDQGSLRLLNLPLCISGKAVPYSGRVELSNGALDLTGQGPAAFILGSMGYSVAKELPNQFLLGLHIGGNISEPRVDLPLLDQETMSNISWVMEGLLVPSNPIRAALWATDLDTPAPLSPTPKPQAQELPASQPSPPALREEDEALREEDAILSRASGTGGLSPRPFPKATASSGFSVGISAAPRSVSPTIPLDPA